MNMLSFSQTQAQTLRQDYSQIVPLARDNVRNESSSESLSSFAKALNEARGASETDVDEVEASYENESSELAGEEASIEENLRGVEADSDKNEKIARRNVGDEEKAEKESENPSEIDGIEGNATSYSSRILLGEEKNAEKTENTDNLKTLSLSDSEKLDVSEKMLSWLMTSSRVENSDSDISDEDFATLIDAAVEFIPGEESESEKLMNAQNLAVNDPKFFLDAVETVGMEENARGAVKSELALDDKKLASSKEKKNDSKISVHDLRTHRLFDESDSKIISDKIVQKAAEKKELNLSMQKQADGNVQMTMELMEKAEQNITSSSSQSAGANGSNFQAMLTNAVQENAPDFVKAGNIILKDNNQGSINLILRPEGLGNVKISLSLDDKNLSAQILVHTKEAMEAFKESIPSLKQAFTESGFETGSFDLNFSNGGSQQGFAQGDSQNQRSSEILAHKSYGEFVTKGSLSQEASEAYSGGDYSVNIVA